MGAITTAAPAIRESRAGKAGNSSSQANRTNVPALTNSPIDQISFLQRTVGNREVDRLLKSGVIQAKPAAARSVAEAVFQPSVRALWLRPGEGGILQRKCACGRGAGMSGECEECAKKRRSGLRTKLKVNQPGDIYEQEADRMADLVLAAPAHPGVGGAPLRIQRFSGQSNGSRAAAPPSVDQALANPGTSLEPALRREMELRFGHGFSAVRVHTDAAAGRSAQDLDSRAYTVGRDVVFGAGQYGPASTAGKMLIAHELAHVAQQAESAFSSAAQGQVLLQRSPRKRVRTRDKVSTIDPRTARLVMELIMTIIAKIEATPTHPSRRPADPAISKYRELLSLWFELTHGKKADGSKLDEKAYASAFEKAKAETDPIFHVALQGASASWRQLASDRWYPNYFEIEKRAESETRIAKLVETTTSFTLASSPEPVAFGEFLRVATANKTRSVVLQRGEGIPVRAVAGQTYYPSADEPRLLLWAGPEGVFFMLGDEIYKQSIAGFSDDVILGIIIKAAQDVAPFVNLITAVVDIAISLTPVGLVYDLTMASKAIAQGNWVDAALELLPGPALNRATKLAKATRVGRAAFRGGAKGAKLIGKAISGTASFVGRGIGKVGDKLKPGVWLVAKELGEAGTSKGYHFLGEGEDIWRAVPDVEAEQFIKCSTCRWTPKGKDLSKAETEAAAAEKELVGEGVEGGAKQQRKDLTPDVPVRAPKPPNPEEVTSFLKKTGTDVEDVQTVAAASFTKVKLKPGQDALYVLRDSEGVVLKVGKTSESAVTNRFSVYKRAGKLTDKQLHLDVFPLKPGAHSAEHFEQALRAEMERLGHRMPWDNTKGRLGRSGFGTPGEGVRSSPVTKGEMAELLTVYKGNLREVGVELGVHRRTVDLWAKSLGLKPKDFKVR